MPPNSTKLWQEGAFFKSFKIVENHVFNEKGSYHFQAAKIIKLLFKYDTFKGTIEAFNYPAQFPGCSGSRNLSDNISDLKAQIAANQKVFKIFNSDL